MKKAKGKRTKIFAAYTDEKPTFKKRDCAGVYLIYNREKVLQYVGYSETSLYKALYRHFQSWDDKRKRRFTYPKSFLCRVIITTAHRARLLEKYLIKTLQPPDGQMKYEYYFEKKEVAAVKEISENLETIDVSAIPF